MCGRFTLVKKAKDIEKKLQVKVDETKSTITYNAAPGQFLPLLSTANPNVVDWYQWGLIPSWTKENTSAYKLINARAETLYEKPMYRGLLRHKRCTIIADGFYEWKEKQPYRITFKDDRIFCFAGLWDEFTGSDGSLLVTFTIITTQANDLVKAIHDRMPLILSEKEMKIWVDPNSPAEQIKNMTCGYPSDEMTLYRVSAAVNSVRNNTSELIQPIASLFNTKSGY